MPPKKQEVSKKTEAKKKEKIVEDKTFGMKNKKGAKQQKFIQTVQQQVSQMGRSAKQMTQAEREKMDRMSKKEEKRKAQEELNMLFKPVEQKVSKGTDPKSVLCAFFKAGQCTKGDKCKFSHDLAIERRCEKRSLYEDLRDDSDDMNNWDEAKLVEVINKKHGEQEKVKPKTAIVCKFFLEAVETNKYGWFWSCPSGDGCIYRHCLPPGFTLKKDKKKEEKNDTISLEDLIEKERAALNTQNLTRVCLESFLKWKEQKKQEKIKNAMAATEKKKTNFAAGKMLGISGRELFEFNPDLIRGDDDEADEGSMYNDREGEDEEVQNEVVREIAFDTFAESGQDYVELPQQSRLLHAPMSNGPCQVNGKGDSEGEEVAGATGNAPEVDEPIDENLFDGEDLDVVDEELGNLNMDG